jgi:hypothetical protein
MFLLILLITFEDTFTSFFKEKKSYKSHKTVGIKVFFLFLLDDKRILIWEAQKYMDPTYPGSATLQYLAKHELYQKCIGASLGDILSGQEGGSLGGILEYDGALLQRLGLHQEQPHHRLLLENNHTVHRKWVQREFQDAKIKKRTFKLLQVPAFGVQHCHLKSIRKENSVSHSFQLEPDPGSHINADACGSTPSNNELLTNCLI